MLKVFSSLFAGDSGFLVLLETVLDDSGNLIVDEELTVDVGLIEFSGLLSKVETVFSEVLEAMGLLDELSKLDELTELVGLVELDIDTAELCEVCDDGASEDVFSEIIGSFVDIC